MYNLFANSVPKCCKPTTQLLRVENITLISNKYVAHFIIIACQRVSDKIWRSTSNLTIVKISSLGYVELILFILDSLFYPILQLTEETNSDK